MSKTHNLQAPKALKRSRRRLCAPNEKLQLLIELTKLLPPDQNLDAVDSDDALHHALRTLPAKIRDYIVGPPCSDTRRPAWLHGDPLNILDAAISRYEDFRLARFKLCGVARVNKLRPGSIRKFEKLLDSLGAVTTARIDSEGKLHHVKDWFGEATESVEVGRIRECEICEIVFWAGRSDARQCGNTKCKSTWSSRLYRERLRRDPELAKRYYVSRQKREAERERKAKLKN